jgi:hypothetical protein
VKGLKLIAAISMIAATSPAFAGVYTDELARCLVEKSTPADKSALVQWMFVAMSQHPSVVTLTKVTDKDIEKHNSAAGEVFVRLLTDTCADQSKNAMKHEGAAAIQNSFQVLGQVAAGDLFANPEVAKVMSGLEKYMDAGKLEALTK